MVREIKSGRCMKANEDSRNPKNGSDSMSDESSAWTHMPALSTNHDTALSLTPNQSKCQIDSTHLVYFITSAYPCYARFRIKL